MCLQHGSLQLDKVIEHKACFIVKCWLSHVISGILYWMWKQNVWIQSGCLSICCWPWWLRGCPGAAAATAQRHEKVSWHIPLAWNNPKSKSEVWFLRNANHFHTRVNPKNRKLDRPKLGTVCTVIVVFSKHLAITSYKWSEGPLGLHSHPGGSARARDEPFNDQGQKTGNRGGRDSKERQEWRRKSKLITSLPVAL